MAGRHAGWDHTAAGRMCQEVNEPFWFGDSDVTAEPRFRSVGLQALRGDGQFHGRIENSTLYPYVTAGTSQTK